MQVIDAARKRPATITPERTVTEAAHEMDSLAVGALIVVQPDGRPVGIVTDRDLVVRGLARRASADARVDSVMSTDLVTLPAHADLRDAFAIFETHAVRRVPLVDGGRLAGVVTLDDLVVDLASDLARLARPVTAQVVFGHPEPATPAVPG